MGKRIWDDFGSGQPIVDRQKEVVDEENRDIRDLLIDQIEFCNVLILNKCDLLEEWQVEKIETLVKSLQREAKIIRSVKADIALNEILNTKLFDLEQMSYAAGWIKELELGYQDHVPETEEYGISSFVYRSNLPMDAERFNTFLEKHFRLQLSGRKALSGLRSIVISLLDGNSGQSCRYFPFDLLVGDITESRAHAGIIRRSRNKRKMASCIWGSPHRDRLHRHRYAPIQHRTSRWIYA